MVNKNSNTDINAYLDSIINSIADDRLITVISKGAIDEDAPTNAHGDAILNIFFYEVKLHSSPTSVFTIYFSFETYDKSNRLSVELSSDCYNLSIPQAKSTLEALKVSLSKKMFRDFSKCIWLHDKESQMFAADLYPKIHETENLIRQFINEVMIHLQGDNWWEQSVPQTIKNKLGKEPRSGESSTTKQKEYKLVAPSLHHIDEKLMLLEIGDLKKIIQLKKRKLNNINNDKVNDILNGNDNQNENTLSVLMSELKKSSEIEFDLWGSCFSNYLHNEFIQDFNRFDSNRNHVAHNKLLDFQAYSTIKESILKVMGATSQALEKFRTNNLSEEELAVKQKIQEYQLQKQSEYLNSTIESETDLSLHDESSIYLLFEEKYLDFYNEIESMFGLRMDLDISSFTDITHSVEETEVFSIKHKVKDETILLFCAFDIIKGWGMSSTMIMTLKHNDYVLSHQIEFTNGDYEYNEKQSYYLPIMEESFDDEAYDIATTEFKDYIEENFEDLVEIAEARSFGSIKDGGEPSITQYVCCGECGEFAICIDENIAEVGQCLRCGESMEITLCENCGQYTENTSKYDDEPILCDYCIKYLCDKIEND